jgi:uncharacterized protein YndB with AHSA1/START domain
MDRPKFVYIVYIATTAEKLWEALTKPEFTRQYWAGCWQRSDWKIGSSWELMTPDGRLGDDGEVLELDPPRRLVVSWRNQLFDELKDVGFTRATFEIEPSGDYMKLTVTHEAPENGQKFIDAVSQGWPGILSSLKTLLETGKALPGTDKWPEGM